MKKIFLLIFVFTFLSQITAQDFNKSKFEKSTNPFYSEIKSEIQKYDAKSESEKKKSFKADLSGFDLPKSIDEFTYQWHREPHSQGRTGTCWSFSTISYFETEVYRTSNRKVALSEMYIAYCEYIEKARGYVRSRGKSLFAEGSEANAVTRIMRDYGVMPAELFTGLKEEQVHHDHSKMFDEMYSFLKSIKKDNNWNEEVVIKTIKSILNYYLGEPQSEFKVDGKLYTPQTYLKDYLKINPDDYIDIVSYKQQPYFKRVEYEVPDNWWHSKEYHNVPLDQFMSIIKKSLKQGFTISIGGDVSEPGKSSEQDVFVIAAFDIPSDAINEDARQFRFSNGTTTDDHGIHMIGYTEKDGVTWFLIKDSGSGSFNGNNKGYYFFHEDYVKLKMMDFMINKDALGDEFPE